METAVKLTFQFLPPESINVIQPLWEKHIHFESLLSCYFSRELLTLTFNQFKEHIAKKAVRNLILIDTVIPFGCADVIGCCISTINADRSGEIDFLCVQEQFRHLGAGTELMRRAMEWMDEHDADKKGLVLAYGNANAMKFYQHLGFKPASITMLWKKEKEPEPVASAHHD